jgi:hypothetical protein
MGGTGPTRFVVRWLHDSDVFFSASLDATARSFELYSSRRPLSESELLLRATLRNRSPIRRRTIGTGSTVLARGAGGPTRDVWRRCQGGRSALNCERTKQHELSNIKMDNVS